MRAGIVAQAGNTDQNMGTQQDVEGAGASERYIVAGSPATVRQQLEELARSLRCRPSAASACTSARRRSSSSNRSHVSVRDRGPAASAAALERVGGPLVAAGAAGRATRTARQRKRRVRAPPSVHSAAAERAVASAHGDAA